MKGIERRGRKSLGVGAFPGVVASGRWEWISEEKEAESAPLVPPPRDHGIGSVRSRFPYFWVGRRRRVAFRGVAQRRWQSALRRDGRRVQTRARAVD